jgi:anti-sigma regulatory factor (Ser/Thr protein kinase)
MENGTFDDLVKEREKQFGHKKIFIEVHINEKDSVDIYRVDVKDEGDGFDTKIMKNQYLKKELYSGRGLVMVSKMVDAFYYNQIGNKVILKKFQKKEK